VLVDKLHECIDAVDGALVNPAGLTQHGVSLHDAIKAMPFPVLENLHVERSRTRTWRAHSIISPGVKGTIQGSAGGPTPPADGADRTRRRYEGASGLVSPDISP
jgi:3-dehydroquinate dehydratase